MKWQATGTPRTEQRIYTIHSLLCFIAILTSTSALSSTSNTDCLWIRRPWHYCVGKSSGRQGWWWYSPTERGVLDNFWRLYDRICLQNQACSIQMVSMPLTTSICYLRSKETTREEGRTNSTSLKKDHYMSNLRMNVCTFSRKESLSRRQKLMNFLKKKSKP